METRIIKFYETTLRDGEQTPGVNYFPEEKLQIAQALADMGFDTLDCGFPISSPGEFEAVRLIASKVEKAEICAIARAHPADIERAWEAVKIAAHPAIQPFISISPLHRRVKLGKSRDEVRELAKAAVAQGRSYTDNVDFALEDTTRTEHDFILEVCEVIIKEGVRFVTLCDTVGFALPWEFGQLVADVRREFPSVRISAHCHDDLGLAVANAMEGLRNGAERVDTCINGLDQEYCWSQRIRPRWRHSPGRRTQGCPHLRNHDARIHWPDCRRPPYAHGQTLRTCRPCRSDARIGLRA